MTEPADEPADEPAEDPFEDPPREAEGGRGIFHVDLDGFEGPLDLLLSLARDKKLDITKISIVALADQYLAFVAEARRRNLEVAAEYLVMAAWLAYLKSRLLLPEPSAGEEPTGEEMAAALAFHIKRLEAMQEAGAKLMAGTLLGRERLARGLPEIHVPVTQTVTEASLYDLLKAYAVGRARAERSGTLHIEPFDIYTVEDALQRLRQRLGGPDWTVLWGYLPEELRSSLHRRSAVAATFAASLELAKEGAVRIRQEGTYGSIFIKQADRD